MGITQSNYTDLANRFAQIEDILSKNLTFEATGRAVMLGFAEQITELGKGKGQTLNMPYVPNIGLGNQLTENVHMETEAMTTYTKPITVIEYGKAVAVTQYLEHINSQSVVAELSTLLGTSYALTVDDELRKVALTVGDGYNTPIETGTGGTERLTLSDIMDAVLVLENQNAPRFGTDYIMVCSPTVARWLYDDPNFTQVALYNDGAKNLNGEIGRIHGVRVITSTLFKETGDTGVFPSVMFGQKYFARAVSLPAHIRHQDYDFQRDIELAWYEIAGYASLMKENGVVIKSGTAAVSA